MRTSQSSLNTHSNKLTGLNRAKTPVRTGVSPLIRHFLLIFALLCLFAAHRAVVPTVASQSIIAATNSAGSIERTDASFMNRADWAGEIIDLINDILNDDGSDDDDDADPGDEGTGDGDGDDDGDGEGEEGGSEPGKE